MTVPDLVHDSDSASDGGYTSSDTDQQSQSDIRDKSDDAKDSVDVDSHAQTIGHECSPNIRPLLDLTNSDEPERDSAVKQKREPDLDSIIDHISSLQLSSDNRRPPSLLPLKVPTKGPIITRPRLTLRVIQRQNESRPSRQPAPAEKQSWDSVREQAHAGQIFLRISQTNSFSPLTAQGFRATSCRSRHKPSIGARANKIRQAEKDLNIGPNKNGLLNQFVKHILTWSCSWDDEATSDWISMSADPDWIFWAMTKRLVRECHVTSYCITIIRRPSGDRVTPLVAYKASLYLSHLRGSNSEARKAWDFANAASEWLGLYTIPASEILDRYEVTRDSLPFKFPAYYFKSTPPRFDQPWIDQVVFEPYRRDTYYEASAQMRARARELGLDASKVGR
ncbi:hypothetical protein I316_04864 [Kwoniella heveanensis BCC8398]|uniref:DUF7587 domain-containing protein n=1 Tax=Kwoniella heveanensis BCC8398 TaxID=1296120 RepID=A0A1B9GQV9_9TREE|nr:hypothetical protein I316_04864 [Kwoniella heveanensis BCC8398]